MTVDAGAIEAAQAAAPDVVAQAHQSLIGQHDLQFDFRAFTPPPEPDWLKPLLEFLQAMGPVFKVTFWVGAALGVATIVYFIVRELLGVRLGWKPRRRKQAAATEWRP